ncbi:MAG: glycosyltransferase family 2 protein [Agarilytica sp.]
MPEAADFSKTPTISIVIPAFNRANTLVRNFESIAAQTQPVFEVVLVDDGSVDNTKTLVTEWQNRDLFSLRYLYQENQGKHIAHNTGVQAAKGEFTFILDSDDWLPEDSLERISQVWRSVPEEKRETFAGLEGHCCFANGEIEGTPFPQDVFDSDFLTMRRDAGVKGDKKAVIKTSVLKEFLYPKFEGERHIRPSLLWKEIALKYKIRYVNQIFQFKELQPGGLSSNRFSLRMRNPKGFTFYYLQDVNRFQKKAPFKKRFDSMLKYCRYAFHAGVSVSEQRSAVQSFALWMLAIPFAYLKYRGDSKRLIKSKSEPS